MAKRGETRPYRMRFVWPGRPGTDGKPIAGTETFARREYAEDAARAQAARVGPTGDRCRVTVTHRDRPDVVLLALDPVADADAVTGRARTELAEIRARRASRPDVLAVADDGPAPL